MNILNYARNLYSLDTLDTRFTTSSRNRISYGPSHIESTKPSPEEMSPDRTKRNGIEKNKQLPEVSPSKWGTLEFYLYYLVIGTALPLMFKAAYDISLRTSTKLDICSWLLLSFKGFSQLTRLHSFSPELYQVRAPPFCRVDPWS